MAELSSRRYAHSEGRTHLCFDSKMRVVTCGYDCDVRIFEGDDSTEFSVSSDKLTAIICYHGSGGNDLVAVGMDDHSVQSFQLDGTLEGLLMRFTAPVTYLAVNGNHSLLAAGSCEFVIKVIEIADTAKSFSLIGHEAPVLCVTFDPRGEYLASSSCDGTVKVWSVKSKECVQSLPILHKSNDVSSAKSLATLSWRPPDGKMIAIPVGSEVKLYDRLSWKCLFSLCDDHHKEAVNVVSWSPCGGYLASGGVDGALCLWNIADRKAYSRVSNEDGIGISSLEWDPRGRGAPDGNQVVFGDVEGCMGVFNDVYPSNKAVGGVAGANDTLADDSLLMEGIPPDDIFDDFNDKDVLGDIDIGFPDDKHGDHDDDDDDSVIQSHKRRRLQVTEETSAASDLLDDDLSVHSEGNALSVDVESTNQIAPLPRKVMEFNEKLVQVSQSPIQPSSTPDHLQHRFMVYNLVGAVRCHTDDSSSMVEVDFHNTGTHHSFSLANYAGYNMAALSERALVLASERAEDQPSQLHCLHFSSWDSNKEWTLSLPGKENALSVTVGDSWIAMVTNKLMLRLFTVGGAQKELLSLPGPPVTLAAWGSRLAVVYQTGLGTGGVFSLTVWVLDVQRRRELHPPHTLPLSRNSTLEWLGFSEEGLLVSYDSKGMVRILSSLYGRSSWLPVLDTNKQLGNKSDHYFIVGMTHNPSELRAILCKGLNYPPVHPKPVMSTLQLKLPLCEVSTEKAQLEDELIRLTMLRSPSSMASENTEHIQQLMKLFALACKSDRDYRAYEIAAMLPDEHSMNLALTYASRTQHLRLARQISELIQQKSFAGWYSNEEETSDPVGQPCEFEDVDSDENDHKYAVERSKKLKQSAHSLPRVHKKESRLNARGPGLSRFSESDSKKRKRSDEDDFESENGVDETKELFTDEEQSGDEVIGDERGGSDVDVEGGEGDSPTSVQTPIGASGSAKRHNPFKMATPISKKVELDRKSSFLDNIVSEDQQRKEKAKRVDKLREKPTSKAVGKKSKVPGTKKSTTQKSLKGSFFKADPKTTPTENSNDTNENSETAGHENSVEVKDQEDNSHSDDKVTSKNKLLAFAYSHSS